jgi:hypothetical protein
MMTEGYEAPAGVLRPSAAAMGAKVEDEVIIFERQQDRFFGVRGAGVRIWQLIGEETHTAADIAQRLCDEFDADAATIRRDVADHLGKLAAHGLIEAR